MRNTSVLKERIDPLSMMTGSSPSSGSAANSTNESPRARISGKLSTGSSSNGSSTGGIGATASVIRGACSIGAVLAAIGAMGADIAANELCTTVTGADSTGAGAGTTTGVGAT